MKIRKNNRNLRKNITKIVGASLGGSVSATLLFVALLLVGANHAARAAATPESCFQTFTPAEGALFIGGYDRSCGADVEIPDVIGGKSVIGVGGAAFQNYGITSVKIPDSVTYIGNSAFAYNDLSAVYIAGNPTLDLAVFWNNGDQDEIGKCNDQFRATGGYDDVNPTGPQLVACLQSARTFAQIYAPNATSNILKDQAYTENYYYNGSVEVVCPAGGHIVNPASLTLHYRDQKSGAALRVPDTYVGKNLLSYKVSDNPTADFGRYYHAGDEATFSAPKIDGFDATGATSQNLTLTAGANDPTDPASPNSLIFDYAKSAKPSEHPQNPNENIVPKSPIRLVAPSTGADPHEIPAGCQGISA